MFAQEKILFLINLMKKSEILIKPFAKFQDSPPAPKAVAEP